MYNQNSSITLTAVNACLSEVLFRSLFSRLLIRQSNKDSRSSLRNYSDPALSLEWENAEKHKSSPKINKARAQTHVIIRPAV